MPTKRREGPEDAVPVPADSEDEEGESGAESFLSDEEMFYLDGTDPVEDLEDEDDEKQQDAEKARSSAPGQDNSSSEEEEIDEQSQQAQSGSPPHKRAKKSRFGLAQHASQDQTRSRPPPQVCCSAMSWKTETDGDVCPVPKRFIPARPPGHQLNSSTTYTPLDLFKLFFSNDAAQTVCRNTNKQAAKSVARGKKYSWTDVNVPEFFKYVGLSFFFALVKLDNMQDYWKKSTIFSVPFPANVMPRDRYRVISWNIHMSDPDKDTENDRKKGTPDYDRLYRLRPLMDTIKDACKSFYHPRQNLSIHERSGATKSPTGIVQSIRGKPTKLGFKLFVLADSSSGYTWDFNVYTGKSQFASGVGLAYDSVMSLVKTAYLGSGFHLYVDNFYTSPKLFKDLFSLNIGACGTYREGRRGCPRTETNALKKSDPRGSIRWLREGPLLFVKWMDNREVSVCSTVHEVFSGSSVRRRVRSKDGHVAIKHIPCPAPVLDYNRHIGGFDLSTQCYSVHHKSMRWYQTLFFHFLDIAATNSYLLHKELCREKQEEPMSHRAFLQELTAQLCGVTVTTAPAQAHSGHLPIAISEQSDISKRASYGRRTCVHCRKTKQVRQSTPWKCAECDVALCVIADRNCFRDWHN
ncbi:piggyBac transposable element-derived protein 4-like [Centropristis striata]|uniref:piggyBac transposable element-derived protein 4-like n=1 Tax=Centropristis striata TaxID=184440 RepID=UPI0027E00E93|nr:piggyBac transposable element-derived protein 4-like [Centropristis striata]